MNYSWAAASGSHVIEFMGSNANGSVNKMWNVTPGVIPISTQSNSRGNATGKSIYVNQTALSAANVTLYYSNGTAYGQSVISGSDGSFQFNNVPTGSYNVTIEKQLFAQKQTTFNIKANMTTDIGSMSLEFLDVSGDKQLDVLDVDKIYQNLGEKGIINCPVCDVNGDGYIDIYDGNRVAKNI